MIQEPNKLGGKQKFDTNAFEYEEYREEQPEGEIQKEAFDMIFKEVDRWYNIPRQERELMMKEMEETLTSTQREELVEAIAKGVEKEEWFQLQELGEDLRESDPYLYFVFQQFMSMSNAERGMVEKVATRQPFSQEEAVAFVSMVKDIGTAPLNEEKVFRASYLKMIMDGMPTGDRVDFLVHLSHKLPAGHDKEYKLRQESYVIGVMETFGLITPDERKAYLDKRSVGYPSKVNIGAKVEAAREGVMKSLKDQKGVEINYTSSAYKDAPKSEMDKRATIGNAGKHVLFAAGVGTLFINGAGAVGKLVSNIIEGKPAKGAKEAIDHIKSHHYILPAMAVIAGTARAIKRGPDRPLKEAIITGDRGRLTTMIEGGVTKDAIRLMRIRDGHGDSVVYDSLDEVLGTLDENSIEKIRHQDLIAVLPKETLQTLKNRGLIPKTTEQREAMMNQLVEQWLLFRQWDYKSFESADNLLEYAERTYSKTKKTLDMIAKEEAEDGDPRA